MRVSVLVPTFRRAVDFERCLEALARQERPPDELVVVARETDTETHQVLSRWQHLPYLRVTPVDRGGQVQALNAGLDAATGDIVMITDDDAAPHTNWCALVEQHFTRDSRLGGVGGRDIVHTSEGILEGRATVTGRILPWGRIIGNHHLSAPSVVEVDLLKGANMSYRVAALQHLRFDSNLRGSGAQVGNDMAFSMAVAKRGWKLLYDPAVQVDHFPSERVDSVARNQLTQASTEDMAFNTWWTLTQHLRSKRLRAAALLWEATVGTWTRPGCIREWVARLRRDPKQIEICAAARKGRRDARKMSQRG